MVQKKEKISFLEKQFLELDNNGQIDIFENLWDKLPFELQHYVKDINLSFNIIDTETRLSIYKRAEALVFCYDQFVTEAKRERLYRKLPSTAINDIRNAKSAIKNSIKYFTKLRYYDNEIKQLEFMEKELETLDKERTTMRDYYKSIVIITKKELIDAGFKTYKIEDDILPVLAKMYKGTY